MNSNHLRKKVDEEKALLSRLVTEWTSKLEGFSGSERRAGAIRSAIGMARLVISEKLPHFEGLISQFDSGETLNVKESMNMNDLEGFHDVISLQVQEVQNTFNGLEEESGKLPNIYQRIERPRTPFRTARCSATIPTFRKKNVEIRKSQQVTSHNIKETSAPNLAVEAKDSHSRPRTTDQQDRRSNRNLPNMSSERCGVLDTRHGRSSKSKEQGASDSRSRSRTSCKNNSDAQQVEQNQDIPRNTRTSVSEKGCGYRLTFRHRTMERLSHLKNSDAQQVEQNRDVSRNAHTPLFGSAGGCRPRSGIEREHRSKSQSSRKRNALDTQQVEQNQDMSWDISIPFSGRAGAVRPRSGLIGRENHSRSRALRNVADSDDSDEEDSRHQHQGYSVSMEGAQRSRSRVRRERSNLSSHYGPDFTAARPESRETPRPVVHQLTAATLKRIARQKAAKQSPQNPEVSQPRKSTAIKNDLSKSPILFERHRRFR